MITKKEDSATNIDLSITNGDLAALKEVKNKWKFKNIEDILRFALAVMKKSEKNKIYVDENGTQVGYVPADSMIEKEEKPSQST